jgi:hypothetical protein
MTRRKKPSGRHPRFGTTRPLSALYRTPGKKLPLKKIVIVCEGTETEPRYFRALRRTYRLSTLHIQIVKGKGAPINVVTEAIKQQNKLDDSRDEVWCVFDVEVKANNPSFYAAVDKSGAAKLRLGVSNPAFEFWYLLHFKCTDRPFKNADDVIEELRKHIPHYDKSTPVFHQLQEKTSEAIENATQLRKRACESWDRFPNPSTGIDKLVSEIQQLKK